MDAQKIAKELTKKYPGKKIIMNSEKDPTEIICETEPAVDPSDKGVAVAVIDRSAPHYHKKTTETYKIIEGELTVYKDNRPYRLRKGGEINVLPGEVHYAVGNEAWVEVAAQPGWNIEDHFLI